MISVCIPTFNGEKYIKQQLLSILIQLGSDDEIIISDHGSNDRTITLINSLNDKRIKVYQNFERKKEKYNFIYVTQNLENALLKASGDIIFLADQDDVWHENKVKITIQHLYENDLILHNCEVVDEEGSIIYKSYFKINGSAPGILKNLIKNSYLGCCMAFRNNLLPFILPMSNLQVPHDIWIGLLAEKYGKVAYLNEVLISYRRHGNNLSASGEKSNNTLMYKISYRINIIAAFLKRLKMINR